MMDEPDNSPGGNAGERRPDTLLTKIRLWTRISSYSYERVAVDEAPTTRGIADLSSIVARTRSHPSRPSNRNSAAEGSHASGPSLRTSAHLMDRLERTRVLSAKYGLDFSEFQLPQYTSQPVQRVERPIRMRIRFWCHHCNTQYSSSSRVCGQCAHQRCNRCVRHPLRRTAHRLRLADAGRTENFQACLAAEPASTSALSTAQNISTPVVPEKDPHSRRQSPPRIYAQESLQEARTRPEHIDSNHSRMVKRPRVRIRHTCHECQRTFMQKESTCSGCGHERCKDCPRNPPRRGNEDASVSNKPSERRIPSLSSESDDGGDEYEHQTTGQEAPTSTRQAGDAAASPRRGSCVMESIDPRDTVPTPPEPPPPAV